jgi:hypothetical protein
MDVSKRLFLRIAGLSVAGSLLPRIRSATGQERTRGSQKIILTIFGGVRKQETFSPEGIENIPHLARDLGPESLFFLNTRNEGVTAHFNAVSSILSGNWQRVDDWGKRAPSTPTLFEYFRKDLGIPQSDVWVVASNKALTSLIGASSANDYGPGYGANVVFPKQLMIAAVEKALWEGRSGNMADRRKVQAELEAMLQERDYEGLGGTVFDESDRLEPRAKQAVQDALASFTQGSGPTSGDELTFFISREIMRKFAPQLLVVILSDVESAHFGSYSLHVAGIRTGDRLVYQLWQEVNANPQYRGKTTMVVVPEFGRDPDGSSTNGFLNHRSGEESCRNTWMMCLGAAVDRPRIIERPVRHIDLCPTLAYLLGCRSPEATGIRLTELIA